MSRADKKQRHKARRDAKRRDARRRNSISPFKRLSDAPGEIEYWMSSDFESFGQMQIFIYKRAAGLTGFAGFLIDRGVAGLKDAWPQMNVDPADFRDILARCDRQGFKMHRTSVDEVRRWVAGSIRWAFDHGMRLPKDWAKPAQLIGGVGNWAQADVSEFAKEFAGNPQDLRQRLIGEPFETFIQRTDIDFIFDDAAPFMDQKSGVYDQAGDEPDDESEGDEDDADSEILDEVTDAELEKMADKFNPAAAALAAETANWLAARNDAPSPELPEAWRTLLLARLISKTAMPDASEEECAAFGFDLMSELSGRIDESRFDEHHAAVGQALEFLRTAPDAMQNAVLTHGLATNSDEKPGDS